MEHCELCINYPAQPACATKPAFLNVNRLDSKIPLHTKSLSYATRPAVESQMEMGAGNNSGVSWSQEFACHWDELLIFEISYIESQSLSQESCVMKWLQERDTSPLEASKWHQERNMIITDYL